MSTLISECDSGLYQRPSTKNFEHNCGKKLADYSRCAQAVVRNAQSAYVLA